PVSVAVTLDGKGGALFKLSDIYTGTTDDQGDIVPGLEGATIELQNENVLSVQREATTDALGEVLFEGLPAGTYRYRASANNHQAKSGSFRVRAGITGTQEVFLDYNLVTVEWNVKEITVEDRYEITLDATYETEVPAAVVSVEPASVNLPAMEPGDVYNGELVITNQGLIRADNVELDIPADGTHYRYELMAGLPDSLEAGETLRVPYKVTALQEIAPDGSGSGGGCGSYQHCGGLSYDYECANGTTTSGGAAMCWFYAPTDCGGPSPGDPGHGEPGGIPDVYTPPSPGDGGTGGGGGSPGYQPIGGSDNSCPGDCPGTPACKDPGSGDGSGGGGGGGGGNGGGGGTC
ncbi:MAG TPA: carboxypeptidase-like regulatory domain-containing protein, partial [Gammaproteobacteria bacterium]|nr:carboxypeptidase-like regulatory domain-containing protein [Gammaproteobacteria bacterium]